METLDRCPVCLNKHSGGSKIFRKPTGFHVNCDVCGDFTVSEEVLEDWLDPDSHGARKLTELCRARLSHKLRLGSTPDTSSTLYLDTDFVRYFIEDGCKGPIPVQQATNIIRFVGDEVSRSGTPIPRWPNGFYALIGAPNPRFAEELARELVGNGTLKTSKQNWLKDIDLTLDGWKLYETEKRGQVAGKYGFLAMKFGDDVLDPFVEKTVKPAVKEAIGYDLVA